MFVLWRRRDRCEAVERASGVYIYLYEQARVRVFACLDDGMLIVIYAARGVRIYIDIFPSVTHNDT